MKLDWAIVIPIIIAFAGYFATYLNNMAINVRKDRLERVNRQLAELYGPLYALSKATDISREAFRQKYHPGELFLPIDAIQSDEVRTAMMLWMTEVFMPFNKTMEKLVVEHADLLIGSEMPQCLLELCAHVASHRVILKKWESGDQSEYAALVPFPGKALLEYAEDSFQQLKQEQTQLLRALEQRKLIAPLLKKQHKR